MSAARPRLTIGVPVYNGEKYLEAALGSIVAQDFDGLEIVVSDNSSTDRTEAICRRFASEDSRLRYVRHDQNRGGVWNVNYLVNVARGELFKWGYYDDVLFPGYVEACLDALPQGDPSVVAVHTRVVVVGPEGNVIEGREDRKLGLDAPTAHERLSSLYRRLANQLEFGIIRTESLRRAGGIRPFIGSEMALLTRILAEGRAVQVDEPLLAVRRHPDQYGASRFTEGAWYSHERQRGWALPFTWLNLELLRAVMSCDLEREEAAQCLVSVVRDWSLPRWRTVAGDFKYLPRTLRTGRLREK